MAEFQERAPRVSANFALTFMADDLEVPGRCVNVSQSGLMGVFAQELDLWTVGELTMHFGGGVLGIRARVARAVENEVGLVFLAETAEDRESITAAVDSARAAMGLREQSAPPF